MLANSSCLPGCLGPKSLPRCLPCSPSKFGSIIDSLNLSRASCMRYPSSLPTPRIRHATMTFTPPLNRPRNDIRKTYPCARKYPWLEGPNTHILPLGIACKRIAVQSRCLHICWLWFNMTEKPPTYATDRLFSLETFRRFGSCLRTCCIWVHACILAVS